MTKLIIEGGIPLKGNITPVANKNSILALIPATVLSSEEYRFSNVPLSSSVRVMLQIYEDLGGKITYLENNQLLLNSKGINKYVINEELAKKERASYMFLGPLLQRFGRAEIVDAGGCKLGNRPVDALFQGLIDMGAKFTQSDKYVFEAKELKANSSIWQLEASVTGTENLVLASILALGETRIYNAASEPHVQDLCNFLNTIGANIKGVGTNCLVINGVSKLSAGSWTVISDHIDIGGLIVAAAITNGEVTIKNAIPNHMRQVLKYYEKFNLKYEIKGDDIFIPSSQELYSKLNIKGDIDKVNDMPWPGFPPDLIPEALTLALVSKGSMRIYSTMYETQLMYVEELKKLGAQTIIANPNMIVTFGPTKFKSATISSPEIIQCAYSIFLCALAAKGKSVINNADTIFRRYPNIIEQFNSLGAKLTRE